MKKIAYLWLILLSFAVVACGGAKGKLVGVWSVESVSGEKPPKGREMIMEFKSDGSLVQTKKKIGSGTGSMRTGKWELAKDNKSITLMPEGEKSATVEIIKLDASEFEFKDEKNTFKLKKKK